MPRQLGAFMFLGYLDDTARTRKKIPLYQVLSTVLIHESLFEHIETYVGLCVRDFVPKEKLEEFKEFHACELYGGYDFFEGIEQRKRFEVISNLLKPIAKFNIPIIYGAVDLKRLREQPYASANPIDMAFRRCLTGVSEFMARQETPAPGPVPEIALLIADDCDPKIKATLRASFRQLRTHFRPPHFDVGLFRVHDDMYFGSSQDSIGLQIADLCGYFIGKHLEKDQAAEGFYEMFKDQIVYSQIDPE
jgi:hypothetical protein